MTVLLGLASQRPIDGLLLGSALIVCVVKVGACVLAHCERVRKLFFFLSLVSCRRAVLTRTWHKSTSAEVSWTEFYLLPRGQRECRRSGRAILRTVCIQIVFVALKNNRRLAMIPLVSCLRSVNICDDCLTHLCKHRHCQIQSVCAVRGGVLSFWRLFFDGVLLNYILINVCEWVRTHRTVHVFVKEWFFILFLRVFYLRVNIICKYKIKRQRFALLRSDWARNETKQTTLNVAARTARRLSPARQLRRPWARLLRRAADCDWLFR